VETHVDKRILFPVKRMIVLFKGCRMRGHEVSRTAEFMAVFRASEHAKTPTSRAFADPLAAALLRGELRWLQGFSVCDRRRRC
jgi:O-methyltransferase involved in polyketide biosynthesis